MTWVGLIVQIGSPASLECQLYMNRRTIPRVVSFSWRLSPCTLSACASARRNAHSRPSRTYPLLVRGQSLYSRYSFPEWKVPSAYVTPSHIVRHHLLLLLLLLFPPSSPPMTPLYSLIIACHPTPPPTRDYRLGSLDIEWIDYHGEKEIHDDSPPASPKAVKQDVKHRESVREGTGAPGRRFTRGTTALGPGIVHLFRHSPPPDSEGGTGGKRAEGEDGTLVGVLAVRPQGFFLSRSRLFEVAESWFSCGDV